MDDANSLRVYFRAALFLSLAGLESVRPALPLIGDLSARWVSNIGLHALNTGLAVLLGMLGLSAASPAIIDLSLGLFPFLTGGLPSWALGLCALLILDLFSYAVHRLEHRVTALWCLHGVHHADVDLDATTGFRHHPGESLAIMVLGLGFSLIIGIPTDDWGLYALLASGTALIQHANLCLPEALDRALRLVVVTPGMHRSHHAQDRAIHDRNFGTVFSFWDQIFRTCHVLDARARAALPIGLPSHGAHHHLGLLATFMMPLSLARGTAARRRCI